MHPDPRVAAVDGTLLGDLTPNFNGLYIALNRLLADHGVLPEIKPRCARAANIASPTTATCCDVPTQMLHAADQPIPANVVVPNSRAAGAAPVLNFDRSGRSARLRKMPPRRCRRNRR